MAIFRHCNRRCLAKTEPWLGRYQDPIFATDARLHLVLLSVIDEGNVELLVKGAGLPCSGAG